MALGWAVWHGARHVGERPVAASAHVAAARVPLVAAVLDDYRRVAAGDLPGRARDLDAVRAATGLPVEPLRGAELHLLGAWTTALDDEAAAVLAYRSGDRLVVQYIVPESLYFRHSALRAAAAAHRPLVVVDHGQSAVAWSQPNAGTMLVSDGEEPGRLLGLVSAATAHDAPPGP
jgi:hypothetical protein